MIDIKCDESGNFIIKNGDLVLEDTTLQEIDLILMSFPGYFKEYPNVGCSLPAYQKAKITGDLYININKQLTNDGFNVTKLQITIPNDVLTIDVKANK